MDNLEALQRKVDREVRRARRESGSRCLRSGRARLRAVADEVVALRNLGQYETVALYYTHRTQGFSDLGTRSEGGQWVSASPGRANLLRLRAGGQGAAPATSA